MLFYPYFIPIVPVDAQIIARYDRGTEILVGSAEMNLNGKTVVITGASSGIGAAAARHFAQLGANVALLARRKAEIDTLAQELGITALAIVCDVADYDALAGAVEQCKRHFGGLDIYIGNAGTIDPIGELSRADPVQWGRAVDVNLKGVFNGMRSVMPDMMAAGAGTIITISSGAAHRPFDGWSAYCTGKAGAAMLTRSADLEGREKGLRVLGLSPGTVATQMQKTIKASGVGPVAEMAWEDHRPPETIAKVLAWMCSAKADRYLGEDLDIKDETMQTEVGIT